MSRNLAAFAVVLLAPVCLAQSSPTPIAIVGATLVDGTGAEPFAADVLVSGNRISAVGPNISIPPDARVIQADGLTLIPGLFDLHTHLPYSSAGGLSGDWAKNLAAYLYCGVTSVVDFGTYGEAFEPMRRLLETGMVTGPRLSLAARITTPGGHGAEGGRGEIFSLEVQTPREARAAIRRVLPYKPDVIKVFTDGWRYGTAPDMTSMREDTLAALVKEAHANDLLVLTHTVTLEKAKIAARAGVDVIAHGIGNAFVDDELIELFKEKRTTYAPTLAVYEPRNRSLLPPLLATLLEPAARDLGRFSRGPHLPVGTADVSPRGQRWTRLIANAKLLHAAGIRIGSGTDAGVTGTHHGWALLRELKLLSVSGLSPLDALTAATGNSAEALGVAAERGAIAPGKVADLVLIEGAPHLRIDDVERIRSVFLNGREVDRKKLAALIASPFLSPLPTLPAQRKIDDFEAERTSIDTLPVNATDPGHDHSQMLFGRILRNGKGRVMSITGRMAENDRPYARLNLPLSRGAFLPVDAGAFHGIEFEARGEGQYRLILPSRAARDGAYFAADFHASGKWKRIRIPFSDLRQDNPKKPISWTGTDLLMVTFEIARPAGQWVWLELDNVHFY